KYMILHNVLIHVLHNCLIALRVQEKVEWFEAIHMFTSGELINSRFQVHITNRMPIALYQSFLIDLVKKKEHVGPA
ncbi:hypothetical protein ACJX0J_020524, partial [Zea mays]